MAGKVKNTARQTAKAIRKKAKSTKPRRNRRGPSTTGKNTRIVKLDLTKPARGALGKHRGMMNALGYLAKTITLPAETEPVRFPNYTVGTDQTGVFHLTTTTSYDFLNYARGTQQVLLTGSPIAPVWWVQDSPNIRYYRFNVSSATAGSGPWNTYLSAVTDISTPPCYPGRWEGKSWVYVPAGISFAVNGYNFVGAGSLAITWSAMNVIGTVVNGTPWAITLAGGAGAVSIAAAPQATWYCIDMVESSSGATSTAYVEMQVSPGRAMYPGIICPSLSAVSPTLEHMRVNSSALLLTNVSKPLYVNGTVTAARLIGGDVSVFTPSAVRTKVAQVNERLRYSGEAAKGCYSYYIPTDDSLTFSDYRGDYGPALFPAVSGATTLPVIYDLRDFTHVNAIDFDCDATTGLNLKFRHDMHLEFQSDAEIFNLDVPRISLDEFFTVVTAASRMVPFTENPVHMAQLVSLARIMLRFLAPRLIPHAQRLVTAGANGLNNYLETYR